MKSFQLTSWSHSGSYAGSKRATELMADTLRLELVPFNVKVLCIATGAVRTLGQTYFSDLKLPDNSLYKPIEETVVTRAQGNDGTERMPLMEYMLMHTSRDTPLPQ